MKDLDAEASRLLIALGIEWAGTEPRMALVAALKAEGDRRAAEMRERCEARALAQSAPAGDIRSEHHRERSAGYHQAVADIAKAIHWLPLESEVGDG